MLKLKNYIWVFLLATGIYAFAFSNICCTSNASNNKTSIDAASQMPANIGNNDGGVIVLNESTFDTQIKKGVVLVDFWATWCGPCRMQSPIIEELSKDMKGKAIICKLDIDKNPAIAERYNIQSIPTMLIFKDGKAISGFQGVTSKDDIKKELNKFVN